MAENLQTGAMLRVGTILRGVYRVDDYISSGGFGNTYLVTNIEFDERWAIKEFFMRGVTERDTNSTTVSVSNTENRNTFESQLSKFKREARILRKLHSKHIVGVHDLFEANGTVYYVMDFIEGESLSERMKRTGRALPEGDVLSILDQVLEALDAAHAVGILHLDIKPGNIMIDRYGTVKLIDFGASKQQLSDGVMTSASIIAFTPGYAPREQVDQNVDRFGPWTDFYALGATLYFLLTNQKPPTSSCIDEDESPDKHESLPFPDSVSWETRKLVLWMMETNKNYRPQRVADIRSVMDEMDGVEVKEMPEASVTPPPIPQRTYSNEAEADTNGEEIESSETKVNTAEENSYGAAEDSFTNGASMPSPLPEEENEDMQTETSPKDSEVSEDAEVAEEQYAEEAEPEIEEYQTETTNNKRKWLWFFLALTVVAAGVFFGVTKFTGIASTSSAAQTDSVQNDTAKRVEDMKITIKDFGECTYTGEVTAENVPNGNGEARFKSGCYYSGKFSNGVMNDDNAIYIYAEGDKYEGAFVNGKFNGKGKYTEVGTGKYYVGTFKDGELEKGTWYTAKGKKISVK